MPCRSEDRGGARNISSRGSHRFLAIPQTDHFIPSIFVPVSGSLLPLPASPGDFGAQGNGVVGEIDIGDGKRAPRRAFSAKLFSQTGGRFHRDAMICTDLLRNVRRALYYAYTVVRVPHLRQTLARKPEPSWTLVVTKAASSSDLFTDISCDAALSPRRRFPFSARARRDRCWRDWNISGYRRTQFDYLTR
jgi:hypothetical protein